MKPWNRIGWASGLAGVALIAAMSVIGTSSSKAVDKLRTAATDAADGKLIMHEWGTFTSFSGSNGVQLDFRPLINEDLPEFVFDRRMQAGVPLFTKRLIRAQIRMETPVTYFYTDEERTVRAKVDFPNGLLTEFYPPVVAMTPPYDSMKESSRPFDKSTLDWGEIDLIPIAKLAPTVKDQRTRKWLHQIIQDRVTPTAGAYNHYYYARETDSAYVHVRHALSPELMDLGSDHLEKFLFYRGVGKFEQPLHAVISDDGLIKVTNSGDQPIRSLFRVTVAAKAIEFSSINEVSAGASVEFPKTTTPIQLPELQQRVVDALVAEKLYPKEAAAMVKTWADSWFAEEGTRIFYMVPREATDKLLPLTISPPPDESVRVLVGRVEVMSPTVEKQLLEIVQAHALRRAEWWKQEVEPNKQRDPLPVPAELLKLGRLAEPALVRIHELAKDSAVAHEATALLHECRLALEKSGT
jgi:hypothetical protein